MAAFFLPEHSRPFWDIASEQCWMLMCCIGLMSGSLLLGVTMVSSLGLSELVEVMGRIILKSGAEVPTAQTETQGLTAH